VTTTIGLIAPGEMGAAVAAAVTDPRARVVWASHGRSDDTRRRASGAGIEDVGDLADLVTASDVMLSICPPHAAAEVAEEVAAHGFRGCYVDANAVSPDTARSIDATVARGGAAYVDGGIVGGPPRQPGTTRLYLAGDDAIGIAALFADGPLEAVALDGGVPAASALKMAYAGWTKGSAALLLSIRALAAAEGVEADLLAEWTRSLPDLAGRSDRAATSGGRKGWRWVGEMDEIAASLDAAGLPGGFHEAAAEVYRRLSPLRDATDDTTVTRAVEALLHPEEH